MASDALLLVDSNRPSNLAKVLKGRKMSCISTDGGCEFATSQEDNRFFNLGMSATGCDACGRDRGVAREKKQVNPLWSVKQSYTAHVGSSTQLQSPSYSNVLLVLSNN